MSLWLSRIALNPMSGRAIQLAGNLELMHAAIYALFTNEERGRVLFRIDIINGFPVVLIQSSSAPNWDALKLEPTDLVAVPEAKPFDPLPKLAEEYSFRLLARPSHRMATGKGNPNGKRQDLRNDEERLAWMHRKGEASGFKMLSCGLTILSFPAVKSAKHSRQAGGSFNAVQFDGVLTVTDPEKLREAVANGIGTQKAYGFGLLSLARLCE